MSNNSKAETLGMPHGTACGKLRKILLFSVLKKHKENICVRCNLEILLVDDLSVEHIKPWEGISSELFWDLENIAFSHMACNRPHRNNGGRVPRFVASEGKNWCNVHKDYLLAEKFTARPQRWNGLDFICRDCRNVNRRLSPDS